MKITKPVRVWINNPSTLQPYHKYHGKKGIAIKENEEVVIYFIEGDVISMRVEPTHLSPSHGW